MKSASAGTQTFGQLAQARNIFELVITNRVADPNKFLADDSACSDCEMAHLGVAHLSIRQSHVGAARLDQGLRVGVTQSIHDRSAGGSYCVVVCVCALTPTVKNRQNNGSNGPLLVWTTGMALSNIHSALSVLKVFSRFISYLRIRPVVNC